MKVLRTVWEEVIGLFVDDWRFAALVIAWIALFKLATPHPGSEMLAVGFFIGLAVFTLTFVGMKAKAK